MSDTPGADTLELTPGERLIEGAKEALAIARGEIPAARITINGHAYVPETELASLRAEKEELRRERDEARVEIERLRDCLRKDPMVLLIAHEDGDHERLSRATAKAIDRAEAAESLLAEAGKALELARSTFAMLVGSKDQITGTSLMAAYASCIEAASAARVVATRIASLTKEP